AYTVCIRLDRSIRFFFFFSSRRRHTRLQGDWSSDVCSSDLAEDCDAHAHAPQEHVRVEDRERQKEPGERAREIRAREGRSERLRSEERRVGKEWRCVWGE